MSRLSPNPHDDDRDDRFLPPQVTGYPAPIVISNSSSASASSSSAAAGCRSYRRQSLWAHFWLLLFTAGLGNLVYAWYITDWNRRHGF